MAITPDKIITIAGIQIKQKIIPDGLRWKDPTKARNAKFSPNALYKANVKMSKVNTITIHNTADLDNIQDDAERYTLATYNENMGSVRPHLYVDESSVWQLLEFDEVAWCNARGTYNTGAIDDIAIECIMNENKQSDTVAEDKTARLAAYFLHENDLDISALRTHTYWINKNLGLDGSVDYLNTHIDKRAIKVCPLYIMPHWAKFKATVEKYLAEYEKPVENIPYKIRRSKDNVESQIGAYSNLETAKNIADYNRGYKVFDNLGNLVYKPSVYYSKYITTKDRTPIKYVPERNAKTISRLPKNTEIIVYLGSNVTAENGTIWVKFTSPECEKFPNKFAYIPFQYIQSLKG